MTTCQNQNGSFSTFAQRSRKDLITLRSLELLDVLVV